MPIDDRTANRNYKLPNAGNFLADDVVRLRDALNAIDADLHNLSASTLSFTQAGPGAVTRTVDSKLRDVVSVKDFGAKGDGVTDDTAAIQAAINAGTGLFPYTVTIPNGNYKTSATIQLVSGCRLIGECRGSVRFLNQFPTGTFALADNVRIENIIIEGTNSEFDIAIVGNNTSRVNLRGVDILGGSFYNYRSKALRITGNTWQTLLCYECVWDIGNQTGWAVWLQGNATTPQNIDTHFRDVFLDTLYAGSGAGGFYLQDVFAPRLSDCLIRTSASGTNVRIERNNPNDTAPCDVLLENCTNEFGNPSIKVGGGCKLFQKGGTTADRIDNEGELVRWKPDGVYVLPRDTAFSWVNQGASTITENFLGEHVLFKPGAGLGTSFSLRAIGVSGNFRLTACVNGSEISKPFLRYGVGVRESATGKMIFYGLLANAANTPILGVIKYNSATSFNSDYQLLNSYHSQDIWLRIERSLSTLYFSISSDGVTYHEVFNVADNDFITGSIDQLFYGLDAENNATPLIGNQLVLKSWRVVPA